jgi:hypothetical protein
LKFDFDQLAFSKFDFDQLVKLSDDDESLPLQDPA